MLFMEILLSTEYREHMQTKTKPQQQTGTESKLIWLLTCVGVGILSGYVIINHVIWTWSRQSHWGMCDFKNSKVGSSTEQNAMFKRKASAVSASSKKQGRKYAGIGPKAQSFCAQASTYHQQLHSFHHTKIFSLTFHPCSVGRICCPFSQSILFCNRWIFFVENTSKKHTEKS